MYLNNFIFLPEGTCLATVIVFLFRALGLGGNWLQNECRVMGTLVEGKFVALAIVHINSLTTASRLLKAFLNVFSLKSRFLCTSVWLISDLMPHGVLTPTSQHRIRSHPVNFTLAFTWTAELISAANPPVTGASWLMSRRPVFTTDCKKWENVKKNYFSKIKRTKNKYWLIKYAHTDWHWLQTSLQWQVSQNDVQLSEYGFGSIF